MLAWLGCGDRCLIAVSLLGRSQQTAPESVGGNLPHPGGANSSSSYRGGSGPAAPHKWHPDNAILQGCPCFKHCPPSLDDVPW